MRTAAGIFGSATFKLLVVLHPIPRVPELALIWLRALFFAVAVQAAGVGFFPWLIARTTPRLPVGAWHWLGTVPIALGAIAILWCDWEFVMRGGGTAAPYDPPRALVAQGLYRHVRNPMYVAAVLIVLGVAMFTGAILLIAYAALVVVVCDGLVRYHEEPRLRRSFGRSYGAYVDAVPRWLPRLRPWRGAANPS